MRRLFGTSIAAVGLAASMAACTSASPPGTTTPRRTFATPSTTATPSGIGPTTSPASGGSTPAPTRPVDLPRVAEAERDDIHVRIELERNPLPAGERSWVRVTVSNRGDSDVTWFHDGCAKPAWIRGLSGIAWPMGIEHPPQRQRFKTYALGGHIAQEPSPYGVIDFVSEENLVSGSTGCTDIGITEHIEPGRSVKDTLWSSGYAAPNRAMLPDGPLGISIGAGYYWRGDDEPDRITDQEFFELSMDAWIDNPDADQLSPALIVDAALGDPQFAAYVDTQAIADGRAEIAWYDADRNVWEVGIMPWYETDPPQIHGVVVDGSTGAIVGPLDRAWDRAMDPFP